MLDTVDAEPSASVLVPARRAAHESLARADAEAALEQARALAARIGQCRRGAPRC